MNRHDTHYLSHERKLSRRETAKAWLIAIAGSAALLFVGGYLDGREQIAQADRLGAALVAVEAVMGQPMQVSEVGPDTFCPTHIGGLSIRCEK